MWRDAPRCIRVPTKVPTVEDSQSSLSRALTGHADPLVGVPKSVCRVLTWVSGYPGKRSRQSEITLQAIVSGMGRLERKTFSAHLALAAVIRTLAFPRRGVASDIVECASSKAHT